MGSTALGQLLALAVAPVLGRLLGPEAFGSFGIYLAVLGTVGGAASWRLGLAVPLPRDDDAALDIVAAGLVATLASTLVSVALVWGAGAQLASALGAPDAAALLWWIPISIFGVGVTDVLSGWCLRYREFPALVHQRVVRAVGTSGWQLVHALAVRTSALPLVVGEALGRLASIFAMSGVIWRREAGRVASITTARISVAFRTQRAFALFATPSHLVNMLGQWLPVFLLTYWWGAVAAGLYVVGQRIIGIPIGLIGDSAGQVYIADLTTRARTTPGEMPALFRAVAGRLATYAAIIAAVLILLGPIGFTIGFGAEWTDAGRMVRWQGIALAIQLVAIPMAHTLVVLRFQRRQLLWDVGRLLATALGFVAAHRLGTDAVGAIAIHGAVTALLYAVLVWASWRAVARRALEGAGATA